LPPLQPFVFALLALGVCAWALPFIMRAARYWRIYDHPGALKIHREPIPRVGGVAMMAGLCACLVPVALPFLDKYGLCILAFLVVWLVGFIDDVRSLSPIIRLCTHLAAGALLWSAGWRLNWFSNVTLDLVATCLFVGFLINAINLFDGLDGLAAATSAVAAIGFLGLLSGSSTEPFATVVGWSLVGCCAGVLVQNFPPARVFMGDSGSTLLGVLLAFLSLEWVRVQPENHGLALPMILLSLPVADAALAIFRRLRGRKSPFDGDRRHFYDLLLQRGWAVRTVLLTLVGATGVFASSMWLSPSEPFAVHAAIVVFAIVLGVAQFLGSLRAEPRSSSADTGMVSTSLNSMAD
jgi:UDP-GlcNAc:undecaprenyl-phosphate GlcNAc-1-phosphate transferase